jgi:hypothetical protein
VIFRSGQGSWPSFGEAIPTAALRKSSEACGIQYVEHTEGDSKKLDAVQVRTIEGVVENQNQQQLGRLMERSETN